MRLLSAMVFCLLLTLRLAGAEAGENEAFNAAARAFQDGFYERATREFADFAQKFPNSERVAEAFLFQAQSSFHLKQYEAALRLLNERIKSAGKLADQYLYWLGETQLRRGDYTAAAASQAQLIKDYPDSSFRLEASCGEALARFKMGELKRTIELLQAPAGVFQEAVKKSTNQAAVARGYLLLGEALLVQKDYQAGTEVLTGLAQRALQPDLDWERQRLLILLELASQRPEAALQAATNLVALALTMAKPDLRAESLALQAEILQRLKQPDAAIQAYEKIAQMPGMAPEQRRQAFLKMVDLAAAHGQLTNAIQRLQMFLAQNPQEPAADLMRLTLGELQLKQFYAFVKSDPKIEPAAKVAAATNLLQTAKTNFDLIITQLTNSQQVGKAYLNRGWCLWEQGKLTQNPENILESQTAFQTAAARLPRSDDQAVARFKWADCQFDQKDYRSALINYRYLIENYADVPSVKNTWFDQALYQIVRASIAAQDLNGAGEALKKSLDWFPQSALSERSVFLYGEALNEQGKTTEARGVFADFLARFPNSALVPEAQLAQARTYVREQNWSAALHQFEGWLTNHANHASRPQAEFDRAWVYDQAGQETNAFRLFTNFVVQFPTHPLAPKAQNWVADYYRGQENWILAEQNYQNVFQNTNWPPSDLAYQARMMAARTAFLRQGYADARGYLTNLLQDPRCPPAFVPEALFVLGEVFVEQRVTDSTNALQNFAEAINAFTTITQQYPTNRLEPLAWGRIGDCHLQLGIQYPKSYESASNAYTKVIESNLPEVPVSARNQAEAGLAIILEKQAEGRPPSEQAALLNLALDRYLNVVYGKNLGGKLPDPFWLKMAGLAAGRLAESLNRRQEAIRLYQRLMIDLPSLRSIWAKKLNSISEPQAPTK